MSNKNVLITGGGRGIGKRIVKDYIKKGYNVAIHYFKSVDAAMETVDDYPRNEDQTVFAVQANLSDADSVNIMIAEVNQRMGSVDIVIHNAGPFVREKVKVVDYDNSKWDEMIGGNLNSLFYLLRATIPAMEKNNWGRFVTIGYNHVAELAEWRYRGPYAAAKTAAASLVKTVALEESDYNINVNMISPGDITPPYKEIKISDLEVEGNKRLATGEDISNVAQFLSSEEATYISGAIIDVAGGKNILAKQNKEP